MPQFPLQKFATLPTPFYFYDDALLRQTLQALKAESEKNAAFHVHYAIKANANPKILGIINESGLGADCVSGGEVAAALEAGIPAEKIVFAGVGKSDREIRLALKAGIMCFNVESLPELEVINALAAETGTTARVAFRINPNIDAHTHEKITTGLNENKFGIAREDTLSAIRTAQSLTNVEYVGLHFHIGSQILELDVYEQLCHAVNALQDELEAAGIATPSINMGGGLGINYEAPDAEPIPAFAHYFGIFSRCLRLRPGQQVHFELGRAVVAQCGTLIARTLYVKQGHTKQFAIVDAGFTELIRPAMYGAVHLTQNISQADVPATEVYDVVGPICESSDVFGKAMPLPPTRRGDFIAFRSAGAYGEAMASTYNCRTLPESYLASEL